MILRVSISSLKLCFEVRWNGTHLIGGWALVAFFLGKDIDMCELFCGQGELTRQCRSDGIDCRGLDLLKNRYHDLTTPEGLLEWILTGELGPFQLPMDHHRSQVYDRPDEGLEDSPIWSLLVRESLQELYTWGATHFDYKFMEYLHLYPHMG